MGLEHVRRILETSPTIAVIGVHTDTFKAAHYVPAYLFEYGYRILGVNPTFAGQELFGERVVASLDELTVKADLVDVFRRPSALPDHLDQLLRYAPRVVWFQLGIRNDEVARTLEAAGIEVVQSRCMLADHRRFGLGRPRAA